MVNTRNRSGYLTMQEASKRSGVHYNTLRRWINDGLLTRYTVGGGSVRPRLRIDPEELDKLITPQTDAEVSA